MLGGPAPTLQASDRKALGAGHLCWSRAYAFVLVKRGPLKLHSFVVGVQHPPSITNLAKCPKSLCPR